MNDEWITHIQERSDWFFLQHKSDGKHCGWGCDRARDSSEWMCFICQAIAPQWVQDLMLLSGRGPE